MSLTTSFLLVSLLVSVSAENEQLSKPDSTGGDLARHRYKRGFYPGETEYEYFRQYFREKGLEQQFVKAKKWKGMLLDWSPLKVKDYADAVRSSTDYYANQAKNGVNVKPQLERIDKIIDDRYKRAPGGKLDPPHKKVVNGWKDGRSRIKATCGGFSGRKKRGIGALFSAFGRVLGRLVSKGRSFRGFTRRYSGIRGPSTRIRRC